MLQCVACKVWFHYACVGGTACLADETWHCECCGGPRTPSNTHVSDDSSHFIPTEPMPLDNTISSHFPDPKRLWPPFGLVGSKESVEALGPACSEVSDMNFLMKFPNKKREPEHDLGSEETAMSVNFPTSVDKV
jgi:hypothetical protein